MSAAPCRLPDGKALYSFAEPAYSPSLAYPIEKLSQSMAKVGHVTQEAMLALQRVPRQPGLLGYGVKGWKASGEVMTVLGDEARNGPGWGLS